jgi:uncharacterized protein YndB with AHSA1/START domain
MNTGTVRIHRVFRAPAERIYRAFTQADALCKWLPPYGFTCSVHHLDAQVGGLFRMSFTQFSSGASHAFAGAYLECVPNEFLYYKEHFEDANLLGALFVRVQLTPVSCGTQVDIEQTGIPSAIPVELCYLGWQESMAQLALLVEMEGPQEVQ